MRGMSYDPDFEKRINNKIETIVETQANLQKAIASLIQVARIHDEQIDRNSEQIASLIAQGKDQDERINALAEHARELKESVNALIRVMEGHILNHS
jgi:ABC-type transporter Mla subunit MlaD